MIEWKDPPASPRREASYKWEQIAEELRAHPGQWALVAHKVSPGTVTGIRNGRLAAFRPAGAFEATGRGQAEGGRTELLYVRYVGEVAP